VCRDISSWRQVIWGKVAVWAGTVFEHVAATMKLNVSGGK